jgi:hypothetical protein
MKYPLFASGDSIKDPAFITPFSTVHFFTSIELAICCIYFFPNYSFYMIALLTLVLHTLYEIRDYYLAYVKKDIVGDWNNNSLFNSIGDTVICILGITTILYILNSGYLSLKQSFQIFSAMLALVVLFFYNNKKINEGLTETLQNEKKTP